VPEQSAEKCGGAVVPLSVGAGAGSPSNTMPPGPRLATSVPNTNVTDRQTGQTKQRYRSIV